MGARLFSFDYIEQACYRLQRMIERDVYVPFVTETAGIVNLGEGTICYTSSTFKKIDLLMTESKEEISLNYLSYLESELQHYAKMTKRGIKQLTPALSLITISYIYREYLLNTFN